MTLYRVKIWRDTSTSRGQQENNAILRGVREERSPAIGVDGKRTKWGTIGAYRSASRLAKNN